MSNCACPPTGRGPDSDREEGFLVADDFFDGFVGDAHVGAELLEGEYLVFGFVEVLFDFVDELAAVSLTFSGDELDVLGVDAQPEGPRFHGVGFLVGITNIGKLSGRISVVAR